MRIRQQKDRMFLDLGLGTAGAELHLKAFAVIGLAAVVLWVAINVRTVTAGLVVFVLFTPCILAMLLVALPNRYFAQTICIDRARREIQVPRKKARDEHASFRFSDIAALLLVEDVTSHGTLGRGPRYRLFLKLHAAKESARAFYVDTFDNENDWIEDGEKIARWTSWPLEYLRVGRTLNDTDLDVIN